MKILAIGDSYMPAEVFEREFATLAGAHELTFAAVDAARERPPATASEHAIREYEGDPAQLCELLDGHDALVVHGAPVTDAVLDASDRLRLVCCARGGPVNVDIGAATERGMPVVTTPGKNAEAVADLTLAFLIMLARRVPQAQRVLAQRGAMGTSAFEGAEFFGRDLGGRTLALVGFGQVGRRVAPRALAFGMDVLVVDPHMDPPPGAPVRVLAELEDALGQADFVSVHARPGPGTENLFDAGAFAAMKPGAGFVNTARETLVDEDALAGALDAGQLGGAALDVLRARGDGRPSPLLGRDDVIVTPHIGGATFDTLDRGARMLAEELGRFAAGEPLRHVINPEALASA